MRWGLWLWPAGLGTGGSWRRVGASSHHPSRKGPPRPATQASATLPAPGPDHSNLKLRTGGQWVGGKLGVGTRAPTPAALASAPCRLPSSHPLDLKQLHVGVVPHGRVHVPGEGVGCHGVRGGPPLPRRKDRGDAGRWESPDPSHPGVPPWAVSNQPPPEPGRLSRH